MKRVFHIFLGSQIKHMSWFVLNMEKYSECNHYYIPVCSSNQEKESFLKFFFDNNITHFKIYNKEEKSRLGKTFYYSLLWIDLLKNYRNDLLVFHGMTMRCLLSLLIHCIRGHKKLCYVNWGYVNIINRAANSGIRKIVSRIKNFFLIKEIRAFHIITLIEPDKRVLSVYKPQSINSIPYPFSQKNFVFSENRNNRNIMLLGNSRWYIQSYIDLIQMLPECDNDNFVNILFSYGPSPKKEEENKLVSLLKNKFKDNYNLIQDFFPLEKYVELIANSTCYVCNHNRQTGLGAIFSAIRIGRDVFVKGSNLLWLRKIGVKAFSIQNLVRDYPDIPRLSIEDLKHNREILLSFYHPERIVPLWDKEFKTIEQ